MSSLGTHVPSLPDFINHHLAPKPFFGEEDANTEWQDPGASAEVFFHTDSYDEFKRNESLFLFGRRGTGKTFLIRMLDYEVNKGRIPGLCAAYVVKEEDAYHELSVHIRSSPLADLPESDLVHLLKTQWRWIITLSAMRGVVSHPPVPPEDADFALVKRFLDLQNLWPEVASESIWTKLASLVSDNLDAIDYAPAKLGRAIIHISRALYTPEYSAAELALRKLLGRVNKNCLVLVDSIEVYSLDDRLSQAVTTALLEVVRDFYSSVNSAHICAKAAFPSEVYPRLRPLNKEKVEGKCLFILWRYKDLFCLLAKRYFRRFGDTAVKRMADVDKYANARQYLYRHFPSQSVTDQRMMFDSIAYIVRHTQKKPRQVIWLFNTIHTIAEQNRIPLQEIPADFISKGVHARLDILVDGALDIFDRIYKNATRIVKRALHEMPSSFDYRFLTKKLPEVNTLCVDGDLDREDVIRLLLECGALGIQEKQGRVIGGDVTVVEGYFEYQVKGVITTDNNSRFLVHPMFYQELQIKVDIKQFVYPVPLEDEEIQVADGMRVLVK
jgi:hypothetical protein